jgi:hypothetical protein
VKNNNNHTHSHHNRNRNRNRKQISGDDDDDGRVPWRRLLPLPACGAHLADVLGMWWAQRAEGRSL